jgi:AcrR family transcriptional regulator
MNKAATPLGTVTALPAPRKTPRQQRSQAKVSFIVEAARQILYEEGVDAVTTRRVAERSGVAVGSLYQYFPNRDSIIAHLAEEEVRHQSKATQEYYASVRKLPFKEMLACSIARLVDNERRMMAFGGEFYRRYSQHYQVAQRVGREHSGDILDASTLTLDTTRLMERHRDEIHEPDSALAAHLLARGISAMLGNLVAEAPELLNSPRLSIVLARIAASVVDNNED